jgi:uncharacterized protein
LRNASHQLQAHPPPRAQAEDCTARVTIAREGPWLQFGSVAGYEQTRIDFDFPRLRTSLRDLRIVHLTDTHLRRRWDPGFDELIASLRRDPPDLLLFTGDFVDNKYDHRPALPVLQRLLSQLKARHGSFAILGNHDGDLLGPRVANWNVSLIPGKRVIVETCRGPVELIGLPSVARHDLRDEFVESLPPRREDLLRVVLAHYPDQVRRIKPLAADIVLAGHTHGGQICLPWGWPPITHDTLPRSCARGVHRFDKTWLVVNRGFGFATFEVRAFCPAQVVEICVNAHNQ